MRKGEAMNTLLSDEELKIEVGKCIHFEDYDAMLDLINTQKRLYAEMVIGRDEREVLVPAKPRQGLPTKDGIAVMRNKLRAEQRGRISR